MQEMQSYPLTIDYNKSLAAMIAAIASHRRNFVAKEITEQNFPVHKGPAKVEAVLLNFKLPPRTEEVLAEMEQSSLRPATLMELMTFEIQHSNQLKFERQIIEFGSVWTCPENYFVSSLHHAGPDRRYVVGLWGTLFSKRSLTLHPFQNFWLIKEFRFLGVRK